MVSVEFEAQTNDQFKTSPNKKQIRASANGKINQSPEMKMPEDLAHNSRSSSGMQNDERKRYDFRVKKKSHNANTKVPLMYTD